MSDPVWHLYLIECDGRRIYTGIALDPERRLREHGGLTRGARFTRSARRLELVYAVALGDRALASRVEHRVKRLSRAAKLAIVRDGLGADALLAVVDLA